jgi:uncharacterized protein with PIN domain
MMAGRYLFFDTSALVKYFHEEPGSARVITLIEEDGRAVRMSALSRVEFVSAIHRKRREGLLSQKQLQQALSGFEEVLQAFHIDPLVSPVVEKADALIRSHGARRRFARSTPSTWLRSCSISVPGGGLSLRTIGSMM